MSHLLAEYSKHFGVESEKPILQEHFFPTPNDKFVTVCFETEVKSKQYNLLDVALSFLKDELNKQGISIYQIGNSQKTLNNCDIHYQGLSYRQMAYLLGRSKLHLGIDGIHSQIANSLGVPTVNLYGNIYSNVTEPAWDAPKENLEAPWPVKPSMNVVDTHESINQIDLGQVVASCFKLLGIDSKPPKTVYCGKAVPYEIVEVIPREYVNLPLFQGKVLNIRMEYGINSHAFKQYCLNHPVSLFLKDKVIPLEELELIRKNVKTIVFTLSSIQSLIPERYFDVLKKWGIQTVILIEDESILNDARLAYFEQDVRLHTEPVKPDSFVVKDSLKFKTNKAIVCGSKIFTSKAHLFSPKSVDLSDKIIDDSEYWKDLEHFYIYE